MINRPTLRTDGPSENGATYGHRPVAQRATAGAVAIVELSPDPGFAGPPLHRHDFDEAFYVIEGELAFQLGQERSPAGRAS
jgi:quercetin dioxygenase-like cupin family protein